MLMAYVPALDICDTGALRMADVGLTGKAAHFRSTREPWTRTGKLAIIVEFVIGSNLKADGWVSQHIDI